MALVLGTNCGFVSVVPSGDPEPQYTTTIDDYTKGFYDTTTDAITIKEMGWYCENATEEANFEVGIFSDSGENSPGDLLFSETVNAKGTDAGWKRVTGLNWELSATTKYWLAVQLDNVNTTTTIGRTVLQGQSRFYSDSGSTSLEGPGSIGSPGVLSIYAVYETAGETHNISKSDTTSLSDSISIEADVFLGISETDTLSFSDSVKINLVTQFSKTETITLTDKIYLDALQTLGVSQTDTLILTDKISIISTKIYPISESDTINLNDTVLISRTVGIKIERGNMMPFKGEYAKTRIAQMTKPTKTLINAGVIE